MDWRMTATPANPAHDRRLIAAPDCWPIQAAATRAFVGAAPCYGCNVVKAEPWQALS